MEFVVVNSRLKFWIILDVHCTVNDKSFWTFCKRSFVYLLSLLLSRVSKLLDRLGFFTKGDRSFHTSVFLLAIIPCFWRVDGRSDITSFKLLPKRGEASGRREVHEELVVGCASGWRMLELGSKGHCSKEFSVFCKFIE